ncbi:MAG: HEPN domain-containing protein [Chitinispirillaceae bacterium]|nr:HEPN domain-containing protein [Chitinispirillaceae bacterium]
MENGRLNEIVRQWILKADHDLKIGIDESVTEKPAMDMVCFHMQQCTEKYLKAYLASHLVKPPRTHDIGVLINECMKIDSSFHILGNTAYLSDFAVEARYPDEFYMPSMEEMQRAIESAQKVKSFILEKIKSL